jgi:hypothetical protein
MTKTIGSLIVAATVVAAMLCMALFASAAPPAPKSPIPWEGNGTTVTGACADNSEDLSLPAGDQNWLFILTSPSGSSWDLTATFHDSGTKTATGVQQGDGSVHFTVTTFVDDTLLSASATNGMTNSVLTVSHCEHGEPLPPVVVPPGDVAGDVAGNAVVAPGARSGAAFTG